MPFEKGQFQIVLSDEALWAEVLNLGGYDVLAQPFESIEVFRVVSSAWRRWNDELWTAAC